MPSAILVWTVRGGTDVLLRLVSGDTLAPFDSVPRLEGRGVPTTTAPWQGKREANACRVPPWGRRGDGCSGLPASPRGQLRKRKEHRHG